MHIRLPGQTDRSFAILIAVLLGLWVMYFHASMIPLGEISHYDEYLALDRITAFERQGDWWNVYSSQQVNFNKPPLQYWMSALLLEAGVDMTTALRAPTWLFAGLCLITTGMLAAAILPTTPWAIPAAVLLITSSERFWKSAMTALLDTGSLLFVTLAMAAVIFALKQPRWWYVVALAVGLGAWQKAPIALALVVLFFVFLGLTARWHGYRFRQFFTNRHFLISLCITILLSSGWHLWQFSQHGMIALSTGIGDQMVGRFTPSAESISASSVGDMIGHVIGSEGVLRWPGFIAVFALPFLLKRYELLPLPLILLTYMAGVEFAGGFVSHRYTLLLTGLFAASLAAALFALDYSVKAKAIAVVVLSLLSGGPVNSPSQLRLYANEKDLAYHKLLIAVSENESHEGAYVYCNWNRSWRIPPGGISAFSSIEHPFFDLRSHEELTEALASGAISGPIIGICTQEQLQELSTVFADIEIKQTAQIYAYYSARVMP